MKLFLFLSTFLVLTGLSVNNNFRPSDPESDVKFSVKNFGIKTNGGFKGLKGDIFFNPDAVEKSRFNVSVLSASVDTDNSHRDKSLREEYFETTKFPEIRIVSTKIEKTNNTPQGVYYFTGTLIMKGVSKEISFPFTAERKSAGYLFTGEFNVNRLDFNIGKKSSVMGSSVNISLSVLAKML